MPSSNNIVTWLPCEVDALYIGAAVTYFVLYKIQSDTLTNVTTDSKPYIQAYQRLCRGEFWNSSRVSTFLSTISRYQAIKSQISDSANLASDFASHNPIECNSIDDKYASL